MESLNRCLCFLLICLSIHSATAAAEGGDFIRSSCNGTLYPDICYATLSPFANDINSSKAFLAETAISVSLKKSKSAAAFVSRQNQTVTVEDCASTLKDAAEQARRSLSQFKEIIGKPVESVRMEVSNVQTWMSAALTNQGTCIDGFEEVEDGSVIRAEVVKRAQLAKKVTSNALAFINKYVNA
ncbi:unnamed protein product [Rhodiola kirilowii]